MKMLNVFSSVQVEKQPDLYGVRLIVTLKKQPVIEEISISGNYPLFKNDVNKVISARIGDPLDFESLQQSARDIEQLYQAEGYYHVRVSIHADKIKKDQKVKVVFRIEKGWRTKIQEVQFEENGKKVKYSFAFQSMLGIYSGNILREVKLKKNIKQMESILINQGFFKVKISYQVIHLSNNYALLKIIIDRGQMVHVRFQGNRSISDNLLRSRITLFENRSYSEFDLQESIEDIREIYLEHGFPFIDASYEKKIQDNNKGNNKEIIRTIIRAIIRATLCHRGSLCGRPHLSGWTYYPTRGKPLPHYQRKKNPDYFFYQGGEKSLSGQDYF